MVTRSTHQVRVRSKTNPTIYVDIEVLDAVALIKPDGTQVLFALNPKIIQTSVTPCIIDNTGDGNAVGAPRECTRLSHMEQFTSQTDPSQVIDLEILDGFALQPPLVGEPSGPGSFEGVYDETNKGGYQDSGQYGSVPLLFLTPSSEAKTTIKDNTGLGLQFTYGQSATRGGHINMVTDKGNTDDKTDQATEIPPTANPYAATVKTDSVNFQAPNSNNVCILVPPSTVNDKDTTVYVTDLYSGEPHVPPDNTDPNIYAFFPPQSAGANLQSTPMSGQTRLAAPVSQGIFWWIKRISAKPPAWYWYAPPTEYLAYSAFFLGGASPCCRPYGYRGFRELNFFSVDYGLGANYPLRPMGSFGSPSLLLCAEEGDYGGGAGIRGFSNWPGVGFPITPGPFGPFDVFSLVDPPSLTPLLGDLMNGPSIWQLTGITQPNLTHSNEPWDAVKNPYLYPNSDLAENVVMTFVENWNSVATACNAIIASWDPCGIYGCDGAHPVPGPGVGIPPAGWHWAIPIPASGIHFGPGTNPGSIGSPNFDFWGTVLAFQNAIPSSFITNLTQPGAITIDVYDPVNIFTMRAGGAHRNLPPQDYLDPAVWDTTISVVPSGFASPNPRRYPGR